MGVPEGGALRRQPFSMCHSIDYFERVVFGRVSKHIGDQRWSSNAQWLSSCRRLRRGKQAHASTAVGTVSSAFGDDAAALFAGEDDYATLAAFSGVSPAEFGTRPSIALACAELGVAEADAALTDGDAARLLDPRTSSGLLNFTRGARLHGAYFFVVGEHSCISRREGSVCE